VTAAYDLARTRRLLLLISAAAKALRSGKDGLPLARAVALTGAKDEKQLLSDIAALSLVWTDPSQGEEALDLQVEDGAVHLTYPVELSSNPPAFSLAEAAVLRAALEPFATEGGKPAKEALRKLARAVPEPLREEATRLAKGLDVLTPGGPWAGAIQEAIARRVELHVDYCAVADEQATRRTVEPRTTFHRDGKWYLAAWSVEKGDEHLYRLDRIASVELGTRVFDAHKGPPTSRYARKQLFFEGGADREVTLRFTGTAAALARERHGEDARASADGSVSVRMRVTPGNYLMGVVMGYGGEATVEGPGDVAAGMRERMERLRRLYSPQHNG
jgi:proteasome accessory factor C